MILLSTGSRRPAAAQKAPRHWAGSAVWAITVSGSGRARRSGDAGHRGAGRATLAQAGRAPRRLPRSWLPITCYNIMSICLVRSGPTISLSHRLYWLHDWDCGLVVWV
jgi:hypothetical protein